MTNLLDSEKIARPLLSVLDREDDREGLSIAAAALVRGQGKTEGLHRRAIRTSRMEEIAEYGPVDALDRVGQVAHVRSDEAGEAGRRRSRARIQRVAGGGGQARRGEAAHRTRWRERLRDIAGEVFAEAAEAAPRTEMRRIRAKARARTMLDAQMAKWLKEVPDGE